MIKGPNSLSFPCLSKSVIQIIVKCEKKRKKKTIQKKQTKKTNKQQKQFLPILGCSTDVCYQITLLIALYTVHVAGPAFCIRAIRSAGR